MGVPRVEAIAEAVERTNYTGNIATHVQYTWSLREVPSWVETAKFAGVAGLQAPVQARAVLTKGDTGWVVTAGL